MTRHEIQTCTDIEALKKLCLAQRSQLSVVSEILVDESKWHITAEQAVTQIRDHLVAHQHDLDINLPTNDESINVCQDTPGGNDE